MQPQIRKRKGRLLYFVNAFFYAFFFQNKQHKQKTYTQDIKMTITRYNKILYTQKKLKTKKKEENDKRQQKKRNLLNLNKNYKQIRLRVNSL